MSAIAPKKRCQGCGGYHYATPRGWRNHMNSAEHYVFSAQGEKTRKVRRDEILDFAKPIPMLQK